MSKVPAFFLLSRWIAARLMIAVTSVAPLVAAPLSLSVEPAVELRWDTLAGRNYQVQWSVDPGSELSWRNLGEAVTGDGAMRTVVDAVGAVRAYRVLALSAGESGSANLLNNGGFEVGNGSAAAGWSATGGIFLRTNADSRDGAFSIHSTIDNVGTTPQSGLLEQRVAAMGGVVTVGEVYTFSFWVKQVRFGPSYVQYYRVDWLNASGVAIGSTGYQAFRGGDGTWKNIVSPELIAPANAVDALVTLYLATGGVAGGHGEVYLDDFALALPSQSVASSTGDPIPQNFVSQRIGIVRWPTVAGVLYQPQVTADLASGRWTDLDPVMGDGTTATARATLDGDSTFFRLRVQPQVIEMPTNLRAIPTGIAGAAMLAWDASATAGVTGYRVYYGAAPDDLSASVEAGAATSKIVSGLNPGQTVYFAVVALTADGESSEATAAISIRAEFEAEFAPLFSAMTELEPDTVVDSPSARITYLADRARDRHAREDIVNGVIFRTYDHYLTWYWEQRVANIEIVDRVGKGGSTITFNYTTQAALNPAEFRAFFNVGSPLSGYHHNGQATLVSTHPSIRYPGETDYNYTTTLSLKQPEGRPLQVGDRMEIEISQFLLGSTLRNGRENYYGTAFLYVVGEGVVPWYAKIREETVDPAAKATASFDSFALPQEAWLGGLTTLPYQYSNEPEHRFKQTAGNISPESGHKFMLGRRLHHTDFRNGVHDEPNNPIMEEHIGKVGRKYVAASCVSCHGNNGRALPPDVGGVLLSSIVQVGSDAAGTPHAVLGEQLQPLVTSGEPEGAVTLSGYSVINGTYGDGTPYTLRKPNYAFHGVTPEYFSVRVAPQLVGMGLLEAIPESAIQALADPDDANGDGISGRLAIVDDPENEGVKRVGRFGHKGSQPKVKHQIAYALNRDMGVTTDLFPVLDGESDPQAPEINSTELEQMDRYIRVLGVGAQRNLSDPEVARGEALFQSASCVSCHASSFQTSPHHPLAELRNQTIRPFTDLLLHDMGPGLADNMGGEGASGAEWRTAPLWNIGLTAGVSGGEAYLHDGRARTLEEAILWHGGEAEQAKEAFRNMPAADREAVVKFLKSL